MVDPNIPSDVRAAVIGEIYRQVEAMDWDTMSPQKKTAQYSRWIEDPAVGGELADHLPTESMRVWLKDGPLKEYTRALEGFGSFAPYVTRRLSPPSGLATSAFGPGWSIVANSIREKPMHCDVTDGGRVRYMCWGRAAGFRDLVWAALNNAVKSPSRPMMVVFWLEGRAVDDATRDRQQRIAKHCDLDLRYVQREFTDIRSHD